MSIVGIAGLLSGKPHHPVGNDGRMALSDHLRELRARLLKSVVVMAIGFAVALFFFGPLFHVVSQPYVYAQEHLSDSRSIFVNNGVGSGLTLHLKLAGIAAVLGTSPFWLYQIWAFIMPGLHPAERKWTRVFTAIASPLFLAGAALGYFTLPKGLEILIDFTPGTLTNLVDFDDYLSFLTRTLLVFGIAFEIPLFVVLLNLAGVLPGKALGTYRPWIIVGTFVFAAAATPSTDPFTMTLMAVPMVLLFTVSEVIARINDRRKAQRRKYAGLSPDEPSPL